MSSYTEGQVHQLMNAMERAGFKSDDLTKLGQFKDLSGLHGLLRGTHDLRQVKHVIDCNADPFCFDGWDVEEHDKGGQLEWNVSKIQLYRSKGQEDGNWVEGNKLRKELKGKPVLNVNVLDYLLKNPHLISGKWKSKYVFFWGTIYRDSDGNFIVRCLHWFGDEWGWNFNWLNRDFYGGDPAILLAS
jgi:hypothetical protein